MKIVYRRSDCNQLRSKFGRPIPLFQITPMFLFHYIFLTKLDSSTTIVCFKTYFREQRTVFRPTNQPTFCRFPKQSDVRQDSSSQRSAPKNPPKPSPRVHSLLLLLLAPTTLNTTGLDHLDHLLARRPQRHNRLLRPAPINPRQQTRPLLQTRTQPPQIRR